MRPRLLLFIPKPVPEFFPQCWVSHQCDTLEFYKGLSVEAVEPVREVSRFELELRSSSPVTSEAWRESRGYQNILAIVLILKCQGGATEACGTFPACGRSFRSTSLARCQPLFAYPWERRAHPLPPQGCPSPRAVLLSGRGPSLSFSLASVSCDTPVGPSCALGATEHRPCRETDRQ